MGRFINPAGVTFSVGDDKDERYEGVPGYKSADDKQAAEAPVKRAAKRTAKKAAPAKPAANAGKTESDDTSGEQSE